MYTELQYTSTYESRTNSSKQHCFGPQPNVWYCKLYHSAFTYPQSPLRSLSLAFRAWRLMNNPDLHPSFTLCTVPAFAVSQFRRLSFSPACFPFLIPTHTHSPVLKLAKTPQDTKPVQLPSSPAPTCLLLSRQQHSSLSP